MNHDDGTARPGSGASIRSVVVYAVPVGGGEAARRARRSLRPPAHVPCAQAREAEGSLETGRVDRGVGMGLKRPFPLVSQGGNVGHRAGAQVAEENACVHRTQPRRVLLLRHNHIRVLLPTTTGRVRGGRASRWCVEHVLGFDEIVERLAIVREVLLEQPLLSLLLCLLFPVRLSFVLDQRRFLRSFLVGMLHRRLPRRRPPRHDYRGTCHQPAAIGVVTELVVVVVDGGGGDAELGLGQRRLQHQRPQRTPRTRGSRGHATVRHVPSATTTSTTTTPPTAVSDECGALSFGDGGGDHGVAETEREDGAQRGTSHQRTTTGGRGGGGRRGGGGARGVGAGGVDGGEGEQCLHHTAVHGGNGHAHVRGKALRDAVTALGLRRGCGDCLHLLCECVGGVVRWAWAAVGVGGGSVAEM